MPERERLEEHGLDDAEDGRRAADPERQGHDDDRGVPGLAPDLPQGQAEVTDESIEPGDAVHALDLLAQCGRIAELPQGGRTRGVGGQACLDVPVGQQVEVRLNLATAFVVEAPPGDQRTDPAPGSGEPAHCEAPLSLNSRAMMPASRVQSSASFARRRRPLLVIV